MSSRSVAAGVIGEWMDTGSFPDRLMERVSADRAFVLEMVNGSVKRKRSLEWALRRLSTGQADRRAMPFLLVGLYQVLFMSDVQPYAAVNETVEASKGGLPPAGVGFVNAVLRRCALEKDALLDGLRHEQLGVRESHPDLLVTRWTARFGAEGATRLCRWNNDRPRVVVRVNAARVTVDEFAARLAAAGIAASPHPVSPSKCLLLPRGAPVRELPGYDEGLFTVQDPSTLAAVEMLGAGPGDRVLDACASPGGKTAAIADGMEGKGQLVAMDLHEDRLEVLRENLVRTDLAAFAEVLHGDARNAAAALGSRMFDRILADVPCTNTGVLQRRADARWRFSTARLRAMRALQREILDGLAPCLAPGGCIVYSVCSLEPEESTDMVHAWAGSTLGFAVESHKLVFPPDAGTDGGYAALLRRRA